MKNLQPSEVNYSNVHFFFFIHIPLSLTLLPWGGNDVQ